MKKILLLMVAVFSLSSCQLMYQEEVTFTVTDKERVRDDSGSKYLIFTVDETFENTDYLLKGKFNSSDIYGQLTIGETYTAEVGGVRVPFLSMYRNIHKIK